MKLMSLPVYYPEEYKWWRISCRREVSGISVWVGKWRRFYFVRGRWKIEWINV